MDALAMSLHVAYHTNSYKEAILKIVNMGGDADTVGAICGMITGAIYGYEAELRDWYIKYVMPWEGQKVATRAFKLWNLTTMTSDDD